MGAGLELKDTARKSSIRDDWIGKPRSIFIRNPLVSIPCPYRVPTSHLELGKSRFLIAFRWQIFDPKIWFRSFTFWTVTFLWDEIRIFRYAGWIRLRILHRLSRTDFYSEMIPSLGEPKRLAIPPSGFALSNCLQIVKTLIVTLFELDADYLHSEQHKFKRNMWWWYSISDKIIHVPLVKPSISEQLLMTESQWSHTYNF